MVDERSWDVALTRLTSAHGGMQVTVPAEIARALVAEGFTRAKVRLTPEGLLFAPYRGREPGSRGRHAVELPAGWGGS